MTISTSTGQWQRRHGGSSASVTPTRECWYSGRISRCRRRAKSRRRVTPSAFRWPDKKGTPAATVFRPNVLGWTASPSRMERGLKMIHELRVFHCVPGRLPALIKRFENDTLRLFEKHGIKQLGFWTVAIGESNNDLFLILQWESLAEREQKFGAFMKDPEWLEARRKSEEDGPVEATITNTILVPTAFSRVR